jgi:hypothetical protein
VDGAYDINDAFEFVKSKGLDCPGTKIKENAGCRQIGILLVNCQKMDWS